MIVKIGFLQSTETGENELGLFAISLAYSVSSLYAIQNERVISVTAQGERCFGLGARDGVSFLLSKSFLSYGQSNTAHCSENISLIYTFIVPTVAVTIKI